MPPKKKNSTDFAKSFKELEELAKWFEQGEPDVDQGIKKFERAMDLAKVLKARLSSAENTIREIRLKETGT